MFTFLDSNYFFDVTISLSEFIGILSGIIILTSGLYQYRKSQRWKKAEFIMTTVKDFREDFDVKRAMLMLDWQEIDIPLRKGELDNDDTYPYCDNDLASSFGYEKTFNRMLSKEEKLIRQIFDTFFDKLGVFYQHIQNKLIKTKDVEIYLKYYLDIIANKDNKFKEQKIQEMIKNYIVKYKFNNVIELCRIFGYRE